MLLENMNILVTGGGNGIGKAVSHEVARHGGSVVIFDMDGAAAESARDELPGDGHMAFQCDITNGAERKAALRSAIATKKTISGLVNNAGIQYHAPFEEMDEDRWKQLFDVNVHAMMTMTRDVGRHMLEVGKGSIVNIGSIASLLAMPKRGAYVTTKTAVLGLTRTVGVEWAGRGVRTNSVGPGYHMTSMLRSYLEKGALDGERIRKRIPMGRLGTVEEIGKVTVFLLSDLASYVTGQHLMVDGGYTTFGAPEDASE